jgi:pimeloyl-ACP methyl ester carboxylesterase
VATYVLVHGGGHGGWCWQRLTPLLRAAGHEVYTPTLTGLGERAHLLRPDIDLETHIADVVGVLQYEGCTDIVLVGHSYGGMVITGVADRAAERVGRLVYLDAAIPEDGQSLVAVAGMLMAAARAGARVVDGVELVLWPDSDAVQYYGITEPEDVEWMWDKLTPHPWKCFEQPLRLNDPAALARIPRAEIHTTSSLAMAPPGTAEALAGQEQTWVVDSGHDLMVTAPKAVAEILLGLAVR